MKRQTREGVALRLDAHAAITSQAARKRVREQLFDVLARRIPVAVTVVGLRRENRPEVAFVKFCKLVQTAMRDAAASANTVSVVLDAADLSPQFAWMVRCALLGEGPVYLLVGCELSRPAIEPGWRRRQDRFWLQSWHLRNRGYVRTAFAPNVTSPCPLFAAERADGILPPYGMQVPPGTAWIVSQINLSDFVAGTGELDEKALRKHLLSCVVSGEAEHDATSWPTAAMRDDSWANRRLAIRITGIGDFATAQGMDPRSLIALHELGTIMQTIRSSVDAYSREMAAEKKLCAGSRDRGRRCGDSRPCVAQPLASSAAVRGNAAPQPAQHFAMVVVSARCKR